MRAPHIRVLLGEPADSPAELVVLPGGSPGGQGRTVVIPAPAWRPPDGPERALAQAYRRAVAEADARGARSMAIPAVLARSPWPLDVVTRVALTVLTSTPSSLLEVHVMASTPAMVERWAEALIREPDQRRPPGGRW